MNRTIGALQSSRGVRTSVGWITRLHILLKIQISPAFRLAGWTSKMWPGKRMGQRIAMLGRPTLSRLGAVAGTATVAVVGLALGYPAWAQQPEQPVAPAAASPKAVWTRTSDAPEGLLTPLEGERHDRFIDRAQAGDIDIVFFGSTETEMWLWRDRGRSVWDQKFGSLKAVGFGAQGTRFASLLWRMQNGELDGYHAKLVVLQAQGGGFVGDTAVRDSGFEDYAAKYGAIIAEIHARQPQAKILLFGVFPRFQTHATPSLANAALAVLGDNETVFFINISDRFFRPDGSFNSEMWNLGGVDVGLQKLAFEVWAEALQPWLERFVR